jgi:hypothetical protein
MLPFAPLFKAKPVASESAEPPSKNMLIASGFIDFLVINSWYLLVTHYETTELTIALLEHYKIEIEQSPTAFGRNSELKAGFGVTRRKCSLLAPDAPWTDLFAAWRTIREENICTPRSSWRLVCAVEYCSLFGSARPSYQRFGL